MIDDTTALENRRQSKGRHHLLGIGMLTGDVFRHLKMHPDQTIPQIHSTLKGNRQSINGALQRLKKAGLVIQVPMQKGNRVIHPYRAVVENETGNARDKVGVEVVIFVNDFGEYVAKAKVVNQVPDAFMQPGVREVARQSFYVVVPKATEPTRTRMVMEPDQKSTSLTIEGEAVHIEK